MTKMTFEERTALAEATRKHAEYEAKLRCLREAAFTYGRFTYREYDMILAAVVKGRLRIRQTISHCGYPEGHILHNPYPWDDPSSRSTYDECRDFILALDDEDCGPGVTIRLVIWNGDSCNGERLERRVTYVLEGEWQTVKWLREMVDRRFERHCLDLYDAELEARRKAGAERIGASLLNAICGPKGIVV